MAHVGGVEQIGFRFPFTKTDYVEQIASHGPFFKRAFQRD